MKYIEIDTPRGQYHLPLHLVAEDRANYYACKVDGYDKDSDEWDEEVQFAMDDSFEAIDWLGNNSDWEDWKENAIKINDKVNVTDADFWCSSDIFRIIEK
jgi:hypothetical protein